jgi:transcriptional regulator with XRE-family HTH domain
MARPQSEATRVLGERLRDRRHALGLSQEAMADQMGVHWTFLGQVERGQRNISLHNLLKLARGLGVDPAELVRGWSPPAAEKSWIGASPRTPSEAIAEGRPRDR